MQEPQNPAPDIRPRIAALIEQLNINLFEKEKVIRLALLSAIAGESIFLLGPPGVAKSMIARRLKYAFIEAKSFEYLMGKFSTPDEVFGPVSISKLKNEDKYERLTDKYLPGANIVFLDEIWKASPPIQNALLTVLNEKIYRNGAQEFKVDIRGLISASNELPLKGEGLEALWDRFLIRMMVTGIQDETKFNLMITLPSLGNDEDMVSPENKIAVEEYESWTDAINEVTFPRHILGLIDHFRKTIRQRNATADPENQMYVSDRRWRKIAHLYRASAFLNGRSEVNVMDCFLTQDCIWNQYEQVEEAHALVLGSIATYGYRNLVNLQPIQSELKQLQEEIAEETKIVSYQKEDILKVYSDNKGNVFYKIDDFWGETPGFIREDDFEKLVEDKDTYVPMFEETGKTFRPFQTSDIRIKPPFTLVNKGRGLPMETETIEKEIVTARRPPNQTMQIWNSQIQLLLETCEKGLQKIENQRAKDEPYLSNHLFVEASFASHVLDSLNTSTDHLLNMKLEIQKTQHSYESIETGG